MKLTKSGDIVLLMEKEYPEMTRRFKELQNEQ